MGIFTDIPKEYDKNQHVHRILNHAGEDGSLGIGFLPHRRSGHYRGVFPKYGALLLLRGSGVYRDNLGNQSTIQAGSFVQRLPDRWHETVVTQDGRWLECYLTFGLPLYRSLSLMKVIDISRPVINSGVQMDTVDTFYHLLEGMRRSTDPELTSYVSPLIDLVNRLTWPKVGGTTPINGEYGRELEQATRLLSSKLNKPLKLENELSNLPVSYERFRKIFRQQLGVSPGEYRIRKRIERAVELLHDGHLRIYQIAKMLGYSDSFAFSKQFKRFMEKSPKQYRQDLIGQAR